MKTKLLFKASAALLLMANAVNFYAQNVSISATGVAPDVSAGLDVNFTDRGLLVPRVSIGNTGVFGLTGGSGTTSMLVYNTNAGIGGTGAMGAGYYYWNGTRWVKLLTGGSPADAWLIGGNTQTGAAGTAYIFGHLGNHHIDFYTNGVVRGRLSNLGEFFIGTTATAMAGDLMNAVSNATFPWAINGYSSFDGSGVYGGIQAGTTVFAAVQGETSSTNTQAAGVRGLLVVTGNGTNFSQVRSGVSGDGTGTGNYRFGVFGNGGTSNRSGGVLGNDYGVARGALAYFSSGSIDYSVYGFGIGYTTGAAGGKISSSINTMQNENHHIGLGIYGGVMGGWIKGQVYGVNFSGSKYGVYVHGKTLTNDIVATLHNTENSTKRIVTYASQSLNTDVSDKGKGKLTNGFAVIKFKDEFKNLIDNQSEIIINITPIGPTNGLYVEQIDKDGFIVKENNNGTSSTHFFWTASGVLKNINTEISNEILDVSFEEKINGNKGIMFDDAREDNPEYSLWWDGNKVRFDLPQMQERKLSDNFFETCRMCREMEQYKGKYLDKKQK